MLRRVLADFMKSQDYQVVLAEDGEDALDNFSQNRTFLSVF